MIEKIQNGYKYRLQMVIKNRGVVTAGLEGGKRDGKCGWLQTENEVTEWGAESVTVIKLQSFNDLGGCVAKLQSCKNFGLKRTHRGRATAHWTGIISCDDYSND